MREQLQNLYLFRGLDPELLERWLADGELVNDLNVKSRDRVSVAAAFLLPPALPEFPILLAERALLRISFCLAG